MPFHVQPATATASRPPLLNDEFYARLLAATLARFPAARTAVRTIRAPLSSDEAVWGANADDTVIVVDADVDARLRDALSGSGGTSERWSDRAMRDFTVRLDLHSVVKFVLSTMAPDAILTATTARWGRSVVGYQSLRIGLSEFLAEAELDFITLAAGFPPTDAPSAGAVYESWTERAAVEPLLQAVAEQLGEDPVALARSLFTEAPMNEGLLHLAHRLTRTLGVDPDSPFGRFTALPTIIRALTEPVTAAESLAEAELAQAYRDGGTLQARATHNESARAMYAEAGRLAASGLRRVMAALSELLGRPTATAPAPVSRSAAMAFSGVDIGSAPESIHALVGAARMAVETMTGGTCKVLRVEEGFDETLQGEQVSGTYQRRTGVLALRANVCAQLDDLVSSSRPGDVGHLADYLEHTGRAALHVRAASTLLHELLHATDALTTQAHCEQVWRSRSWHRPIGEAITELTSRALLPEFLARCGLAGIDPMLGRIDPIPVYAPQTAAFEPVVRQVAEWLGVPYRDEIVALKSAGGPEESMALLATQVTSVLGIDVESRLGRDVARPAIRTVIEEGMAALQNSLDSGPEHTLRGDPFGGLLAQHVRESVSVLVALRAQLAVAAGRAAPTRPPGAPEPGRVRAPEQSGPLDR